jgi:rubrerythrin
VRSRAAAAALSTAGFKEVYSMEGGIHAWKGLVAEGLPEAGIAYFSPATRPEELMALAWYLENGSQKFYFAMAQALVEKEAKDLFKELVTEEERHQASLSKLYTETSNATSDSGFPKSVMAPDSAGDVMEGGIRVSEALQWTKGKGVQEILELSMSLESNSYDLYLLMAGRVEDPRTKQTFHLLASEEKRHLDRLGVLIDKRT